MLRLNLLLAGTRARLILSARWSQAGRMVNAYGPTETTVMHDDERSAVWLRHSTDWLTDANTRLCLDGGLERSARWLGSFM